LQIGTRVPIPCTFGIASFRRWPGTSCEDRDISSCLGILTLGCCYILSARLVEGQGWNAKMVYASSKAARYQQAKDTLRTFVITVNIGDIDEDITRCWEAIFAPGKGWRVIVSCSDDDEDYLAPWSVSRKDKHCVVI